MALSVYNSNWAPLQHLNFSPEMTIAAGFPLPELDMELLGFQDRSNLFYPACTSNIDPLVHDPNLDLDILPHLPPPPLLDNSIINPPQSFEYSYLKRQKCYEDEYYDCCYYYPEEELVPRLMPEHGFVANPPDLLIPEFSLPEIHGQVVPANFDYGCGEEARANGGGGGGSLSAQSVAARQRRRKIKDKTQELGKLIPGGHKMNTAQMFHAASNYIKYLQAQVGILQLMMPSDHQENEESLHKRELQALASSPSIQEKLYSSEKCLVPEKFIEALANYPELQSNSLISTELHQLIRTSSG